jgi:hypothetical protein
LPSEVLLIETAGQPPDAAVLFDQWSASSREYRAVAYLLSQSPTNLVIGSKAVKQFTDSLASSRSIPVFTVGNVPASVSAEPPGHAVWDATSEQLTIHLDGYPNGPFVLPTSQTARRTALRAAVAPLAVAADAAIVGAVLFVFCAENWPVSSMNSGIHGWSH